MRAPSIPASWSGKKGKARADAVEALHDAERAHIEAVQNETTEARQERAHIEAVQDETADAARQERAEMAAAQEIFRNCWKMSRAEKAGGRESSTPKRKAAAAPRGC